MTDLERAMKDYPPMWCVYDHPSDYPEYVVARKWYGPVPTEDVLLAPDRDTLRFRFLRSGLQNIGRYDEDDAKIVEVWL